MRPLHTSFSFGENYENPSGGFMLFFKKTIVNKKTGKHTETERETVKGNPTPFLSTRRCCGKAEPGASPRRSQEQNIHPISIH